jgi:hypothetical protein
VILSRTSNAKTRNKKGKRPLFWKTAGASGKGEENRNHQVVVRRIRALRTINKISKSF